MIMTELDVERLDQVGDLFARDDAMDANSALLSMVTKGDLTIVKQTEMAVCEEFLRYTHKVV